MLGAGRFGVTAIGCQRFRTSPQWLHRTQGSEDCPTLVTDEPGLVMCGGDADKKLDPKGSEREVHEYGRETVELAPEAVALDMADVAMFYWTVR